MNILTNQKVKASHLSRNAYLYIRQSTLRQVYENSESTKRQYALKQQAISLGWSLERIITIDSDLGQSGSTSIERSGFQELVAEVGMGHAGIVIGLEVSRLSRSSSDWSRLLEICAITDTLIMDEDGIYDTNDFNDRLLLGLKGTISEAELHFLQARMRGGLLNKAKRGELKVSLPIGFAYNDQDQVILDPDQQVQQAIHLFFQTFKRVGSASGLVKEYNKQGLKFPVRLRRGLKKGELLWVQMLHSTALRILHNPRYAGVYFYGGRQVQRTVNGKKEVIMPREQWHTFMKDAHPGYITFEQFEHNLNILRENSQVRSSDRLKSPPREGPALLQGIVVCGICGKKMTLRYKSYHSRLAPIYQCQGYAIEHGEKLCQSICGRVVDEEISGILIEMVTPLALEVALLVQEELNSRRKDVEKFYLQHVERARYEVEFAKRRYLRVDPDNRLVASELEAQWNLKLTELEKAQEMYENQCKIAYDSISDEVKSDILKIAEDFPRLWNDKNVTDRERKRMVRLLIEDVTLLQEDDISIYIRFKGGTTKSIKIPRPFPSWKIWQTEKDVIKEIDYLTNYYTSTEIAEILNKKGVKSGAGKVFNARIVNRLIHDYGLKNRYERLLSKGLLTLKEKCQELNVSINAVRLMRERGEIIYYKATERDEYLYEPVNFQYVISEKPDGI
jgi:DNA invertase Pin-like site-specific DNA recombinase